MQKQTLFWLVSGLMMVTLMSGCSRDRVQTLNNRNASQPEALAGQSTGALPTLGTQAGVPSVTPATNSQPTAVVLSATETQPAVSSSPSKSDLLADDLEKLLSNLETQLNNTDLLDDVQ